MDANEFAFYKQNHLPVVAYSSQAKGFFSKMAEQGESALSEKAKKRYFYSGNIKKLFLKFSIISFIKWCYEECTHFSVRVMRYIKRRIMK